MITQRLSQPLVIPGWNGLLVLLFAGVALAGASGVMVFSYMDVRERQTEFALLKTLGFSSGQLRGVVWFNLLLVVICGTGLGIWVGYLMSSALLPALEVAEEGVRVTPPMVLETGWLALLPPTLALVVAAGITIPWLAWLTSKLDVQRVLRLGGI